MSLYCASCEVSVWSSAFHGPGDHRCPGCEELLVPCPVTEGAEAVPDGREVEA